MTRPHLIASRATGRRWGDKQPETTGSVKIEGIRISWRSFDGWEGPIMAGEQGEYFRFVEMTGHRGDLA